MDSRTQPQLPGPQLAKPFRARGARDCEYNEAVEQIRATEYAHMAQGVYLDHGGATIHAKSLVSDFSAAMLAKLWGNPHSDNLPARTSGDMIDEVRAKALEFLGADPHDFDLIFMANATAAIKLVAEAFRDLGKGDGFQLGYHREVHSSILGMRELTEGHYHCYESDEEVERWLEGQAAHDGSKPGLFAYPGQSNLSGRRLPKTWLRSIRASPKLRNTYTLFDAAALAMTSPLGPLFADPEAAPDFTCLSFYKIFGFPDLGALVVRRASGHILTLRRYFGGGTIAQVYPLNDRGPTMKKGPASGMVAGHWDLHDGLEDGTLPFHSILALGLAIDTHIRLYGSMDIISRHTSSLARSLYRGLISLKHCNGLSLAEVYVDDPTACGDPLKQGGTIAFNVRRDDGAYLPWNTVEKLANDAGVYVRAGGVCCPGGVSKALRYETWEWSRMFSSGHSCGSNDTAVIHGKPTGIVRVSVGAMSTIGDVEAFLEFLGKTFLTLESKTSGHLRAPVMTPPESPDGLKSVSMDALIDAEILELCHDRGPTARLSCRPWEDYDEGAGSSSQEARGRR